MFFRLYLYPADVFNVEGCQLQLVDLEEFGVLLGDDSITDMRCPK